MLNPWRFMLFSYRWRFVGKVYKTAGYATPEEAKAHCYAITSGKWDFWRWVRYSLSCSQLRPALFKAALTMRWLCAVLLLAGTVEAEGVDLKNIPPLGESLETIPVRAMGGVSDNGDITAIKTDKDGYVIPSPCYERMKEAMRRADLYLAWVIRKYGHGVDIEFGTENERRKLAEDYAQFTQTMVECVK